MTNRRFISIYFVDGDSHNRKKKDITLSFNEDDTLYERCKKMGSSKIKDTIGIYSYTELKEKAEKEGRSVNNYMKYLLKKAFDE